jgi:hypothetical protein
MRRIAALTTFLLLFTLAQSTYRTQISNYGTIIQNGPTIIFENGFEEGSFAAWTGTVIAQGQSLTCVTATNEPTSPHHGNYQAKAVINGSLMPTSAYAYKDLPNSSTTIDLRFYVYLSTFYCPTQPHETYLGTIASGENILTQIGLTETTGELVFIAYYSGITVILYSQKTLSLNVWHCFEMQRIQDLTNGEYHIWLDGTELTEFKRTNVDTSAYTATRIYVGNYHGCAYHAHDQVTFYIDCVTVSNTYLGEE